MEALMAGRKTNSSDYEGRFFDLLMDKLDKQDQKLDEIHKQTRKTNGRVTMLERWRDSFKQETQVEQTPIYKDPRVIQLAILIAVVIAGFIGVDVTGLL